MADDSRLCENDVGGVGMMGWEVGCVVTEESMRYGWCGNDVIGR